MSATIHPVLDATGSDSEPSPQAKRNPAAQPGADDAALARTHRADGAPLDEAERGVHLT